MKRYPLVPYGLAKVLVMVTLTSVLIFAGSAESRDGDDRLEAKVDKILDRLTRVDHEHSSQGE